MSSSSRIPKPAVVRMPRNARAVTGSALERRPRHSGWGVAANGEPFRVDGACEGCRLGAVREWDGVYQLVGRALVEVVLDGAEPGSVEPVAFEVSPHGLPIAANSTPERDRMDAGPPRRTLDVPRRLGWR